MAENLNYAAEGSKCYNDSTAYCEQYGRLYDWKTAKTVCPNGWHLPDSLEWEVLSKVVGGKKTAGKYLKAISGWKDYEGKSGNGKDKYGFSALPGGYYVYGMHFIDGYFPGDYFLSVGYDGYWWGSNEGKNLSAYCWSMSYTYEEAGFFYKGENDFFSVRCLQDK